MKRYPAVIALSLVLLAGVGLYWVAATDSGTHWLLRQLQIWLPQLSMQETRGNLRDGLQIQALRWQETEVEVQLRDIDAALNLWGLLTRGLDVTRLRIDQLTIAVTGDEARDDTPIELPPLSIPLGLTVQQLELAKLTIAVGETHFAIEQIQANVHWQGDNLTAASLKLTLLDTHLAVRGGMRFRADYPLQLSADFHRENGIRGRIDARGDLRQLQMQPQLNSPVPVRGKVQLNTLDSALPLSGHLELVQSWDAPLGQLQWARLSVSGGILTQLEGALSAQLQPDERLGQEQVSLETRLIYRDDTVIANPIRLGRDGQKLTAECQQQLTDQLPLQCSGQLEIKRLTPWPDQPDTQFESPWQLQARWQPDWQLNISLSDVKGQWRRHSLSAEAEVTAKSGQVSMETLTVQAGDNRLDAAGQLSENNHFQIQLNAPELAQLHPQLAGTVSGNIELTGSIEQPNLAASFLVEHSRWQKLAFRQARLNLNLQALGAQPSSAELQLEKLAEIDTLSLKISGRRSRHQLKLAIDRQDWGYARLGCNGSDDGQNWHLRCPSTRLDWQATQPPLALAAESAPEFQLSYTPQAKLQIQPFCLAGNDVRLCLAESAHWQEDGHGNLMVTATGLAPAWANIWLPGEWQFEADNRLNATLAVNQWAPLQIQARVETPQLTARWSTPEPAQLIRYQQIQADISLDEQVLQASIQAGSEELGRLEAELTIQDPRDQRLLAGQLRVNDLQVKAFAWTLPMARSLTGAINGQIDFSGSSRSPKLSGQLKLADGGARLSWLKEPLSQVFLAADFNTERADLSGAFTSGPAQGQLTGQLMWPVSSQPLLADLKFTARQVALQPLPNSELSLSPDLDATWDGQKLAIQGRVKVDSADIQLQELPEAAVSVSPDAEIVGAEKTADTTLPVETRLQLQLGDSFHFAGFGAEARLAGDLEVLYRSGKPPQARGEIKIATGRYRAYGQRLTVRSGSAVFAGPLLNPDLQVEAIRDLNRRDIVVGVRISGTPQRPYAQLFSEPAMPESTIAHYILTGKPPGQNTAANDVMAENVLMSLGLAGSEGTAAKLAERFGVKDLQLGTGTGAYGTEAQVSAYLLPNLYVRYGVSLEQDADTITFQYQLTPRLFLEAVSGIDSALDIIYSFERQRPRETQESDGE